jgi:acetyl esterase/lipase
VLNESVVNGNVSHVAVAGHSLGAGTSTLVSYLVQVRREQLVVQVSYVDPEPDPLSRNVPDLNRSTVRAGMATGLQVALCVGGTRCGLTR